MNPRARRRIGAAIGLILLGVAAWWWWRPGDDTRPGEMRRAGERRIDVATFRTHLAERVRRAKQVVAA